MRAWLLAALVAVAGMAGVAAAAGPAFDHGRLFRVDREGTPASWVYGTLHSNDPRVTALPAPVVDALAGSRTAAFETLLVDADVAAFLAAAQYDDGRRLTDHLDAATFQRVREALGADAPDARTLASIKPWGVLLMLAQPRETGPASLDLDLQAQARSRRLGVIALEMAEEQVASLDAIPLASQLALLRWALATRAARRTELEATTLAWLDGDLAKLHALAFAPGQRDPALMPHLRELVRHLITNRNLLMAHRLYLPLRRGRVFVAVGALHLHGPEGLLALIVQQGYRVTRVL